MKNGKRVAIIIVLILAVTVIGIVIVISTLNRSNNTIETVNSFAEASVVSLSESTQETLVSDNPAENDFSTTEDENGNWELPELD